jgi:hypothetical protein
MPSFSWGFTYSFYQSYSLSHLQDFSDFSEDRIHTDVQLVDLLHQEITVLDVAQGFKIVYLDHILVKFL